MYAEKPMVATAATVAMRVSIVVSSMRTHQVLVG
jgi:hypothetical protein